MRDARPSELSEDVVPVLQLGISEEEFDALFPMKAIPLEPLAAAEPSKGALIRLDSGSYVVVTYGQITHRALIEVPAGADALSIVRELLSEVDMPSSAIEWNRADVVPAALAGTAKSKNGA